MNQEKDDWSKSANCATTDPEAFFPEQGENTRMAKKVCDMCLVKTECLEDILTLPISEQIGFAGGLSSRARKAILRASF